VYLPLKNSGSLTAKLELKRSIFNEDEKKNLKLGVLFYMDSKDGMSLKRKSKLSQ